VGFNVNGRTFSVIAEWHTYMYITLLMVHMPGGVYNFQGRASFTDVLDWDRETG